MTVKEIMAELEAYSDPQTKKTMLKHGSKEPFFGVKIEHLKKIQKKVKVNGDIAKGLFATGNADAQYLAGLVADDAHMTKEELKAWADAALSTMINEYTVPWVAAGNPQGWELGMEWIGDEREYIAACGWATLSNWLALKPDSELDKAAIKKLLKRVEANIHKAQNRVCYTMNGFMIAVGAYVPSLTEEAIATAQKIGTVIVDMHGTACKVPAATGYILKIQDKGAIGKKKKTVKC